MMRLPRPILCDLPVTVSLLVDNSVTIRRNLIKCTGEQMSLHIYDDGNFYVPSYNVNNSVGLVVSTIRTYDASYESMDIPFLIRHFNMLGMENCDVSWRVIQINDKYKKS